MIQERLAKLRKTMGKEGVDCYLIPTSDYHDSEYISDFFQVRRYFSGFTGSAGTLIVSRREAVLFTDGRYFIQAEKELQGSSVLLMKMGEPGVPTREEYLEGILQEGQSLGFDGRIVNAEAARVYEKIVQQKKGRLIVHLDLAQEIWQDRPKLVHHPVFFLEEKYSGESTASKLVRLREEMKKEGAGLHILTSLDDIAWLFNMRGSDVAYCPVALSYAVVSMDKALLFAGGRECFSEEGLEALERDKVELQPYESFWDYVAGIREEKILLCKKRVSFRLFRELSGKAEVIDRANPTTLMKAVKNDVEMENLRKAHLKDGIAVTRFMYWLKKNVGKEDMDEVSAAEYLTALRSRQEHFIEPSFETICAYGENGAIIHYSAVKENCARLKPKKLVMVDSGGHYLEGTTDITRTFVLGDVSQEEKRHFTLVLRAMLNLRATRFLYGCRGSNLDIRAREVLWEEGLDYKHGTGHGVGYLLNVHEGPNSFRLKQSGGTDEAEVLRAGMVTSDEPGIYIEGSHGIRIENELLCRKGEKNEYGQFMYFEDLTCVPIDLDGVDVSLMEEKDKKRLNEYHREVYERLSPYFEGEEKEWLLRATRQI